MSVGKWDVEHMSCRSDMVAECLEARAMLRVMRCRLGSSGVGGSVVVVEGEREGGGVVVLEGGSEGVGFCEGACGEGE